ncbi:MAG: PQQ-binding-like beta-propeller repeat protein [Planctomycetota bacterium]
MRLTVKRWFFMTALAALCVGCSTGQSGTPNESAQTQEPPQTYEAKIVETGLLIEPLPAAALGYRVGWAVSINPLPGQQILSTKILGDMVIVVEGPQNFVTAYKLDSGAFAWKIKLGSDLETFYPPVRDLDEVYINSQSRIFTLNAKDGKVTAVAPLQVSVNNGPVYDPISRLAIFAGSNGLVFGHSVRNNFSRWGYRLANRIDNPPVITEQDVFVVDTAGNYALLESRSGELQWRNKTFGDVVAAPAIQGSEVLVASTDRKLYSINRTSGLDSWQYLGGDQELTQAPIPLGRLVLLPLPPDNGVVALDALEGNELWRTQINANPVAVRDQDLLMHTDDSILLLDLGEGKVLEEQSTLPLQDVLSTPDEGLILVNPSGRLLHLKPRDG